MRKHFVDFIGLGLGIEGSVDSRNGNRLVRCENHCLNGGRYWREFVSTSPCEYDVHVGFDLVNKGYGKFEDMRSKYKVVRFRDLNQGCELENVVWFGL